MPRKKAKADAPSPLDELRVPADRVWAKIDGGDEPSDEELMDIVRFERAAREAHLVADEEKANKRAK